MQISFLRFYAIYAYCCAYAFIEVTFQVVCIRYLFVSLFVFAGLHLLPNRN